MGLRSAREDRPIKHRSRSTFATNPRQVGQALAPRGLSSEPLENSSLSIWKQCVTSGHINLLELMPVADKIRLNGRGSHGPRTESVRARRWKSTA